MNALFAPGAKRNRLLLAIGLTILLVSPAMLLWASRRMDPGTWTDAAIDAEIMRQEALLLQRATLPPTTARPVEFSPFGAAFPGKRLKEGNRSGMLSTSLGTLDPKNPRGLLKDVPDALLYKGGDVSRVARGEMVDGLNFVMLDHSKVEAAGLDAVQARIEKDARIIRYLPNDTLLVWVEANRVAALGASPDIVFAHPLHPAYKIAPDTGRRPLFQEKRATDPNLILEVYGVPGRDGEALKREIGKVEGVKEIADYSPDGLGYQVTAFYTAVPKLARIKDVLNIQESFEFVLSNSKNVPTVQLGSYEDTLGIRPFDIAGVDGGGIDTNGDGQRINDGSDTVPPQIVGVTDNGISYDTPSFAQTGTQPATLSNPIGPTHRKVHAIHAIQDNGSTCDAVLSGAGTHGNVVSSTIAAYPTQLGAFATTGGIGVGNQPRNEDLDGVARGARIIMQDAAGASQCTISSLIERGGNVTPGRLIDDLDKLLCPKLGGGTTQLCNGLFGGGADVHLAVLPFGAPDNFSNIRFPSSGTVGTNHSGPGEYPQEAADLDTFLYNNRDFMIVSPVGNSGGLLGGSRLQLVTPELPDFFDGTAANDDPNNPHQIQVQPPATAKNIISVGSHRADDVTFFGTADTEQRNDDYSSRGPASPESNRTAPILMAPASDLLGAGVPSLGEVAAFRSTDNDNQAPVEAQLDTGNFGTSYAAGYVTGAAALVRDYFAQGFFPTGGRNAVDRVPNVSGALVKASLVASARFLDRLSTLGEDSKAPTEHNLRRTRSYNEGTVQGIPVGIQGNSEQGYGRVVLTQVLPLANWSRNFVLEPNDPIIEHPAAALLAFDDIATHEPRINNSSNVCLGGTAPPAGGCGQVQHLIRVLSADTNNTDPNHPGSIEIRNAELRIGLAWPDPPSPAGFGGPLVNDLDLVLEGPGADNCLTATDTKPDGTSCAGVSTPTADNEFFDGNNYNGGHGDPVVDSWSLQRVPPTPEIHDTKNPQEAIHISSLFNLTPLYAGTYRLTVKRGGGGAVAGSISGIVTPSEDTNGNFRLDKTCVGGTSAGQACYRDTDCAGTGATCTGGEDTNGNGLLDLDGQSYALVVSGPVYLAEAAPAAGPTSYPQSNISFSSVRYSCSSGAVLNVFDSTAGAGTARSQASTTFTVLNSAGVVVDTESNIVFNAGSTLGSTASVPVQLRLNSPPPVANDGVLEVDSGQSIVATYAPAGQRAVTASANVQCTPDFINAPFLIDNNQAYGPQFQIAGGCDNDEFLDASEVVTYGVALINRSRVDDYNNVTATLTPSGPGAGVITVLDSPKLMGRIPAAGSTSVFFHVSVGNAAAVAALPLASRKVTMSLTLDATSKGQRLSRLAYSFTHAINADRQTFHYSTDFPNGGFQVRDLNRNLTIDQPDTIDPFKQFILPDEIVQFSTMFIPGNAAGAITNTLGEDLNGDGVLDLCNPPACNPAQQETDVIPNGVLDRGILAASSGPTPSQDRVPWNFDLNNGGWVGIRHPESSPGAVANEVWEYKTSGLCGFQTSGGLAAGPNHFGIWHTGDGNPATPGPTATACDNYVVPHDQSTPNRTEIYFDVLHSPIVAKVHQVSDATGFPYTVEFQRFAANFNMQTFDSYAGGGVNIDNDADDDKVNCMLCQEMDIYYTRRFGGWPIGEFRFAGVSFSAANQGIDPKSYYPYQRTFGYYQNPNGTALDGDETGFTGNTQNTNPDSLTPIPDAQPNFLPFPVAGAPVPGVCTYGAFPPAPPLAPLKPCQTSADCGTGGSPPVAGVCNLEIKTANGPVRNFETTLIGYEGGFVAPENGLSSPESYNDLLTIPGQGGNRWEIGIGFFSIESASLTGDYGFGVDDVLFEWDEFHPLDETQFTSPTHTPACQRFNAINPGQGFAAGGQCASITADRTALYECESAIQITVVDPKIPSAPSVQVSVVTESDSIHEVTPTFSVLKPNSKRFTLPAVPGSPGLFRGDVTISSQANNPNNVFADAASDATFTIYYADAGCDANSDGVLADSFDNLDGDGVADNVDNCPFIYNPNQADADGDHIGDLCDNCIQVYNPDQADTNADGVGDVCDYDDVDGDGVANTTDNCPDVYNPDQASAVPPRGDACSGTGDLDHDGVPDNADNCVLAFNPAQTDSDGDKLGDACDGDCAGVSQVHICSNAPLTGCTSDSQCPGGFCQTAVRHTGLCSLVNDDADADGVEDAIDDCPEIYNPPIIPGTKRQLDSDRNGIGDACDPPGNFDKNRDGVPDDIPFFAGTINCKVLPLAKFTVLATQYKDVNGDQDAFPDPGEFGRLKIFLQNTGPALTGANFHLGGNGDGSVACVNSPTVPFGNVAAGQTIILSDFDPNLPVDPSQPGFFFTTSDSVISVPGQPAARVNLCLSVTSDQAQGVANPICFSLLGDLNLPVGQTQTFTVGPDGSAGTSDDGTIFENFDVDRDGDGNITIKDTFLNQNGNPAAGAFCSNAPGTACTSDVQCPAGGFCLRGAHGSYINGSATGVGGTIAGVACGGFTTFAQGNAGCRLHPLFPFDWHIHCAHDATNCPNLETNALNPGGTCLDGCSYTTPLNDDHAISGHNSIHQGAHFDLTDAVGTVTGAGDTQHLRVLQAFATPPINLAVIPRPGDLQLSFYHIEDQMTGVIGVSGPPVAWDYGQVQIRVDNNPDPNVDAWGFWDRLIPFQNVYDHTAGAWSSFTPLGTYCDFGPTDTGNAPPAPRGVHETMCFPEQVYSNCGDPWATAVKNHGSCAGPGVLDGFGSHGVWVQSKFNLANFLGQRVQIRWIGETWDYDSLSNEYPPPGPRFATQLGDDGWWLDDIQITGTIQSQVVPVPDTKTPPAIACTATGSTTACNPNASVCSNAPSVVCASSAQCISPGTCVPSDHGTSPVLNAFDLNANLLDGITHFAIGGMPVRISGFGTSIPGGCTDGAIQYQFFKNGALVQDWSSKDFYPDSPDFDADYTMHVRCSADFSCTSSSPSLHLAVYRGDSADIVMTLTHTPAGAAGTTTLHWLSHPEQPIVSGYQVLTGTTVNATLTGWTNLLTPCKVNQATPINTDIPVVDPNAAPAVGGIRYYLVGHQHVNASIKNTAGDSLIGGNLAARIAPITCP